MIICCKKRVKKSENLRQLFFRYLLYSHLYIILLIYLYISMNICLSIYFLTKPHSILLGILVITLLGNIVAISHNLKLSGTWFYTCNTDK